MVEFDAALIGMTAEEEQKLESTFKDLDYKISVIFDHDFKNLNRMNAEQFMKEVTTFLDVVGNHIKEYEADIDKFMKTKDVHVEMAKELGVGEGDPYFKATAAVVEGIKRFAAATVYRAYMIEILRKERRKVASLISEVKNIEIEKIKIDTTAALYENLLKKQDQMHDKIEAKFAVLEDKYDKLLREARDETDRERRHVQQLMSMLKEIRLTVKEIDREADERYQKTSTDRKTDKQDLDSDDNDSRKRTAQVKTITEQSIAESNITDTDSENYCDLCNWSFSTREELFNHRAVKHATE